MKTIIAILFIALMAAVVSPAQENENLQKVADNALLTFKKLAKQNYEKLGLRSADDVEKARLGTSVKVFIIRLDDLKEASGNINARSLLKGGNHYVYPVLVNDAARSSIDIEKIDGRWQATSFGGANFVRLISQTINQAVKSNNISASQMYIVRIPAMNLLFIGFDRDDRMMIVPVTDNEGLRLKAGETVDSDSVMKMLIEAAKKHNGEPG